MAARKPGKVGWGIMSTALIGTRVVIPAMMRSNKFEFPAIPPRDQKRADEAAKRSRSQFASKARSARNWSQVRPSISAAVPRRSCA